MLLLLCQEIEVVFVFRRMGLFAAPSRVFYACYEHWTNPASPTPLPEPRPNDAWVVASDDETNASPGAPGCTSESDTAASVVGDDEDLPAAPSPQKRRRRDPLSNEDTEVETPRWFRVRDASDAGWTCKRGNALLEALASPESADQPFPQTVYPVLWTHAVLALRERLVEVRVVPTTTAPPPAAAGVQVLGARVNTAAAAGVRRYCPIARPSVFMAVGTSKRTLLPLLRLLASAVLYATPRVLQAVTFAVPPDLLFAADLHPPARVNRVLAELARQVGVCACPLPVRDGRLVQFTCAGLLVPHLGASWRMQHCGELVAVSRTLHAWGRDNGLQCYNATPRRVTINRADLCSDGDGDDGEPLAVLFAAAACQNRTVWAVVQFTASVVNGPNAKCRLRVAAQKILSATPVPVPRS